MNDLKAQYWRYSLITIIIILGGVITYESLPFFSGVLGACTIYILVRNQMKYLTEQKKIKNGISVVIILLEVILCFLIPVFLALWLLANRISNMDLQPNILIKTIQHFVELLHQKTGYNLLSNENVSSLTSGITSFAQKIINQISSFVMNCVVLIFFLYFMLQGGKKMEKYIYEALPFSERNKKELLNSTKIMIRSNAIGIPLLGIIQGGIATIGYIIFDTPDPIIFGFLTCFATIIPIVGTAFIWAPLCLYMGLTGDWINAIGLTLFALIIISNVDNLVRFMLQKKLADTHPLITIIGAIIGLSMFGFWGVIFGPLLISLFLICFDIFKKEYID